MQEEPIKYKWWSKDLGRHNSPRRRDKVPPSLGPRSVDCGHANAMIHTYGHHTLALIDLVYGDITEASDRDDARVIIYDMSNQLQFSYLNSPSVKDCQESGVKSQESKSQRVKSQESRVQSPESRVAPLSLPSRDKKCV